MRRVCKPARSVDLLPIGLCSNGFDDFVSKHLDRLISQACRVLCPGGVLAGTDSTGGPGIRLIHKPDTMVLVNPNFLLCGSSRRAFGT